MKIDHNPYNELRFSGQFEMDFKSGKSFTLKSA